MGRKRMSTPRSRPGRRDEGPNCTVVTEYDAKYRVVPPGASDKDERPPIAYRITVRFPKARNDERQIGEAMLRVLGDTCALLRGRELPPPVSFSVALDSYGKPPSVSSFSSSRPGDSAEVQRAISDYFKELTLLSHTAWPFYAYLLKFESLRG